MDAAHGVKALCTLDAAFAINATMSACDQLIVFMALVLLQVYFEWLHAQGHPLVTPLLSIWRLSYFDKILLFEIVLSFDLMHLVSRFSHPELEIVLSVQVVH